MNTAHPAQARNGDAFATQHLLLMIGQPAQVAGEGLGVLEGWWSVHRRIRIVSMAAALSPPDRPPACLVSLMANQGRAGGNAIAIVRRLGAGQAGRSGRLGAGSGIKSQPGVVALAPWS